MTALRRRMVSEMTADEQRVGWVGQWASKHYKQMIVVRALLAPWILFVTVFLCLKGYWWGLVFLPFLALDLWLLRSLVRYARRQGRLLSHGASSGPSQIVAEALAGPEPRETRNRSPASCEVPRIASRREHV